MLRALAFAAVVAAAFLLGHFSGARTAPIEQGLHAKETAGATTSTPTKNENASGMFPTLRDRVISGTSEPETESAEWYPVAKVVDGDTVVILKDGERTTLRLIGLDTPETVDPRKPVQCFGREASEKAKEILTGTSVQIETDASQGALDKYGRTLAYMHLRNGANFNKYMIAEGYGHEYTYNLPYKYQSAFKEAEQRAREQKKGLWADDACPGVQSGNDGFTKPVIETAGKHECSHNVYNCSDFASQAEAQATFNACGGSANDIHKLDADADGKACESLP